MTIQKKLEIILRQIKEGVHPSDLAEYIEEFPDQQKKELFSLITDEEAALIIQEMEDFNQVALFRLLTRKKASEILKEMASDNAADLLGDLTADEVRELLALIGEEGAEEIEGLLKYPEDSAGGIMTTEYIALPAAMPVDEAIIRLREIAPEAEIVYYVYVVDDRRRLIGVLSLRELIAATDMTLLADIMRENVISVSVDTDQEEVARIVSRYDLLAVPVVDQDQRLLGIITVDDILDVIEEEATEDIYHLVGAADIEGISLVDAAVLKIAGRRLPWLFICLLGGILSGSVIGYFEETLQHVVLLAVFIPVIMDMGGNVGSQSSTVFVRGIATGEIDGDEKWRYFVKEILVGLTMGLITGLMIGLISVFWKGIPALGLVVGIAMFITVFLGALIGVLVPLIFSLTGADPALASGPFVTTIKDVTGLLIYFWVATLFLRHIPG